MKTKRKDLTSLDEFLDLNFGKRGTRSRNEYESGFEHFKLGFLIQNARISKGLTQAELADKAGTTKSYISKIENDIKEVRLSTLQKIVHKGLGGHLNVTIQL